MIIYDSVYFLVKLANNMVSDYDMNKIVERIKSEFSKTPDLKIKEIRINLLKNIYVVYLETICDSNKINNFILKNLTNYKSLNNLNSNIPSPNTIIIKEHDQLEFYLTNGFAIILQLRLKVK